MRFGLSPTRHARAVGLLQNDTQAVRTTEGAAGPDNALPSFIVLWPLAALGRHSSFVDDPAAVRPIRHRARRSLQNRGHDHDCHSRRRQPTRARAFCRRLVVSSTARHARSLVDSSTYTLARFSYVFCRAVGPVLLPPLPQQFRRSERIDGALRRPACTSVSADAPRQRRLRLPHARPAETPAKSTFETRVYCGDRVDPRENGKKKNFLRALAGERSFENLCVTANKNTQTHGGNNMKTSATQPRRHPSLA